MEIVQERLEREFDQDLITTAPSVVYQVVKSDGEVIMVENPSKMPEVRAYRRDPRAHRYRAPVHAAGICGRGHDAGQPEARRADQHGLQGPPGGADLRYAAGRDRAGLLRQAQIGEPRLCLHGLCVQEYRASDVVKVDILLNGDKVDALSIIVHRSQSAYRGRAVVAKMREIISRQMYDVAIQAAIGSNIIARRPLRPCARTCSPSATAATSPASASSSKTKKRQKRMKQIGSVEVPQEAFLAILQVDE